MIHTDGHTERVVGLKMNETVCNSMNATVNITVTDIYMQYIDTHFPSHKSSFFMTNEK